MNHTSRCSKIFVIILMLAFSLAPNSRALETGIISQDTKEKISKLVQEGDIPSLQICIVSGDEINVMGFGEQTEEDTMFLIGSVQKVFVAISILQLYERGVIDLDDDVNEYLPFSLQHPYFPSKPITIRMLLSHRSGLVATPIPEFCFDWDGLHYPEYRGAYYPSVIGVSLEDYLTMSLSTNGSLSTAANWVCEPDTKYSYSNIGYKVLMLVLERVTGQSISEYMNENIFNPLQMHDTGFNGTAFNEKHAVPHTRTLGNSTNKPLPVWDGRYMLRSSARDMGHLLVTLCNEGNYDGYQLLHPETLDLMFENLSPNRNVWYPGSELKFLGYGLGLEVRNHGLMGHGGSTVGFTSEVFFNPSTGLGYVRLSNVNAILDYRSNEWMNINGVTDEIRLLVMTEVGMLPLYDKVLIILTSISVSIIVSQLIIRLRRRAQTKKDQ